MKTKFLRQKKTIIATMITATILSSSASFASSNVISDEDFNHKSENLYKQAELSKKEFAILKNKVNIAQAQLELQKTRLKLNSINLSGSQNNKNGEDVQKLNKQIFNLKTQINQLNEKINSSIAIVSEIKNTKHKAISEKKEVSLSDTIIKANKAKAIASDLYLTSVYGKQDNLRGVLLFRGGTIKIKKGSVLPGGWKVVKVSRSFVLIKNNLLKKTEQISFKSQQMISQEMALKQQKQKDKLEVEKLKLQSELIPAI